MEPAVTKTKPSWTSAYTVILFAMVACMYLWIMPSFLKRPDLLFLKPIGQLLFIALIPATTILARLDAGTLTRGLLLLFFAFYMLVGAGITITIYEDWPQWVAAWNGLVGR